MMMKVLRLTPHFYHPPERLKEWSVKLDPIGGMQTQIYRMVEALSQKGIRQSVLTIRMKGAKPVWFLNSRVDIRGVNIPIIPIKSKVRGTVGLNFYWGMGVILYVTKLKFKELRKRKKDRFQIIHSHCSGVAAPFIAGIAAKKILKIPLVFTVHCCRVGTYEPMNHFDERINKYVIAIERYSLSKSDCIFVLTERTKKLIEITYPNIDSRKIHIIPDIISFNKFQKFVSDEKKNQFYEKYKIPKNKEIIAFAGRVAHEKGWKYLVQAIPLVKNQNVHFVFGGDGNEREELESLIKHLHLSKRVTITGFIPNDEVANLLSIASVVVIPSVHEELGSVLLEAASLKKAVIASAVGGLTQNVKDNERGLLVESKSPNQIAKKIDLLLNDKELGERLGQNLHDYIKDKYDEEVIMKKVIKYYKQLLHK